MTGLREKVARSLMIARGGCDVTDWREAEWNPHVAQAIIEADAAIAVCMEEAAKVVEEGFDRPVGKPWRHDGQRSKLDLCTHGLPMTETCEPCIAAALRALRGEGGVDG